MRREIFLQFSCLSGRICASGVPRPSACKQTDVAMWRRCLPAVSQLKLSSDLPLAPDGAAPAFGIVVEEAENCEMDIKVRAHLLCCLGAARRYLLPRAKSGSRLFG